MASKEMKSRNRAAKRDNIALSKAKELTGESPVILNKPKAPYETVVRKKVDYVAEFRNRLSKK